MTNTVTEFLNALDSYIERKQAGFAMNQQAGERLAEVSVSNNGMKLADVMAGRPPGDGKPVATVTVGVGGERRDPLTEAAP
jgi:hypothetical protein